jgi:hypothetical protein
VAATANTIDRSHYSSYFRLNLGVLEVGQTGDRRSWTILRGRFRRKPGPDGPKRAFGIEKAPICDVLCRPEAPAGLGDPLWPTVNKLAATVRHA